MPNALPMQGQIMSSKRKRIALVVRPAAGGIRRHVTLLAARLVQHYDVMLFAPEDFSLDRPVPAVQHIPLPISARTRFFHDFRTVLSLTRLLESHSCDLVHAHGIRAAVIGVWAASRIGIPAVFSAHNLLERPSLIVRRILSTLAARSVKIIAVSNAVKETLIQAGISGEKIEIVPNGIDLDEIDSANAEPLPTTGKVIAGIGRLSPEKGFDFLIQAFGRIVPFCPEAHLYLAGTGLEEAKLRAQAELLTNCDRIHFLGYVAETASVYRAADVVAVPSRQEGQGIVALEAMAYRKPFVAFDVGGLRETVGGSQAGLLVKPEHVEALAEALLLLLRDPAQCRLMGEAGRKRVEQEYTADLMAQRIMQTYKGTTTPF
jgi:glycosyltransferase involved in cell wall biosynthesis